MTNLNSFVQKQQDKCTQYLENYLRHNESAESCPPHFDGSFCWPPTPSGMSASIKCPLVNRENETMSRWCSANTTDIGNNILVFTWHTAQYTDCSFLRGRTVGIPYLFTLRFQDVDNNNKFGWLHEKFYVLDQIGFSLSTICLFSALCIFWRFSQLQDTRVKVHINLFTAMLLHSLLSLIHNFFYGCEIFFTLIVNRHNYEDSQICRALVTLGNYFELTQFVWLLIEGWYFYNFISRAPFHDNITIRWHQVFGWVSPLAVIIPWLITHMYAIGTNFCWIDLDMKINIIAIPVLLIILVNLCFFILNVRIVFVKMKFNVMEKKTHYWRWIKSSLMLVPLFGTYDILYGIGPWITDQQTKIIFLFIVRIICSFQGCIVSALYCFTNDHVKKKCKELGKTGNSSETSTWKSQGRSLKSVQPSKPLN